VVPADPQLVAFFSAREVSALTGLSLYRLRRWSQSGIFRPGNRRFDQDAPVALYDFRDLVGLRALSRFSARLPIERLLEIGGYLSRYADRPWSQLKFHVSGTEVMFIHPDGKLTSTWPPGQLANAEWVNLSDVAEQAKRDALKLRQRAPGILGTVVSAKNIQGNQPTIAGTRIPTEAIWSFHRGGYDIPKILAEYPSLTAEDVKAAIEFEVKRRAA